MFIVFQEANIHSSMWLLHHDDFYFDRVRNICQYRFKYFSLMYTELIVKNVEFTLQLKFRRFQTVIQFVLVILDIIRYNVTLF